MRTLALDGRMGASGDMLLAALLAAGADRSLLAPVEDALGVRYTVSEVDRNGIAATSVEVLLSGEAEVGSGHDHAHSQEDDENQDRSHQHTHGHEDGVHEHSHEHTHAHDHEDDDGTHDHGDHGHDHAHEHRAEGHGPHRHYDEVVEIVEGMDLPTAVRDDALAIFERLGEAEASVHGTDISETHFHEVGADDAIADVVGVAVLLSDLDVERVLTTPIASGGGEVEMSHGTYPVPAPAVVEIAEDADWALEGGPVDVELLTPTAAAILAEVATGVDSLPAMDVEATGYGAGGYTFERRPNVLRATVGATRGRLAREDITVLETNLDDATPEVLGELQRTLRADGARDVNVTPITMKKSRPGHLVRVVCDAADAEALARRLIAETGTLGVREEGAGHRWVAERRFETATVEIDGEDYEVDLKIATDEAGTVLDVSAEYEDAAAVAAETGRSVREILDRAEATRF